MFPLFTLLACFRAVPAEDALSDTAVSDTAVSDTADTDTAAPDNRSVVVDLATSEYGTCAVTGAGELWCWGTLHSEHDNWTHGLAGPTRVEGLPPVVEVELGRNLCVRYSGGSVGCFNPWAVHVDEAGIRVDEPGLRFEDAALFDVGHVYVLRQDAAGEANLHAWYAQTLLEPMVLAADTPQASISVADHLCARGHDGSVTCSGAVTPDGLPPASLLRTGIGQLCVLDDTGAPWCWDLWDESVAAIPGIVGAVDLSVGRDQACALQADGRVSCWGEASVDVAGLPPIARISGDYAHTCAVDVDGGVWCWGDDTFGQLGAADTGPGPVPVVGLP